MQIDFATAGRIIFGAGKRSELAQIAQGMGKKAFLVRSKSQIAALELSEQLKAAGIDCVDHVVQGEPKTTSIQAAVEKAREFQCDYVIGMGGGSVIDTGKAVAAMLANHGDLMDYLEVVGLGHKLEQPSKPYIAVPSTAGTGSEVTRNAVIAVPEKSVKVSMRSPYMLPTVALVDPELTYSVPPAVTAATGMDAFVQVIEPYVTHAANPMVDMFCRDAIPLAARNLLAAFEDGSNQEARTAMSWVSLMGGLSLANAKLGGAHGFAGPIGGMYPAAHGAICAAVIAAVMQINIRALRERDPRSPSLERYGEIARWVTGDAQATAEDGAVWMGELCKKLTIPGLSDFGIKAADFGVIVEKSQHSSSMQGNPLTLTEAELTEILQLSL
jgi:alcohol dehydrogenase class IV